MHCREFTELADLYLQDELLAETNHNLIKHLDDCPACRRELVARRETRAQLRRAFAAAPDLQMRSEFAFRLRNNIKTHALGKHKPAFNFFAFIRRPQWLAVVACLAIAAMIGFFAVRQQPNGGATANDIAQVERQPETRVDRQASPSNQRELGDAAVQLASIAATERAVGDHQNCAIKYDLPEEPIALNEAGRKYDAAYTDLAEAVKNDSDVLAGSLKYIEDHSCVYQGQRFAHIVLERSGRTVSLLVAEKSGAANEQANADVMAGLSINGHQVSRFETKRHTVFIVSDLTAAENLAVARDLAPTVSAHIARAEA